MPREEGGRAERCRINCVRVEFVFFKLWKYQWKSLETEAVAAFVALL